MTARAGRARRTPRRLALLLSLALLAPLAACGDAGGGLGDAADRVRRTVDPAREHEVAADPDATAAEIVEVGSATRVASSGDRLLVAWRAESDDDEGPQQGAWRLYAASGDHVAEGTFGLVTEQGAIPEIHALADGFLVEDYASPRMLHLDRAGEVTPVAVSRRERRLAPGDVLVEVIGDDGGRLAYRPSTRSAAPTPDLPFRNPQDVVLDDGGALHVRQIGTARTAVVSGSAGGAGPWTRSTVPLQPGGHVLGLDHLGRTDPTRALPDGVGDRLVLVTGRGSDQDGYPALDGLWERRLPDGAWQRRDVAGLEEADALDPHLQALPDGRLLLADDRSRVWREDEAGGFTRIDRPGEDSGYPVVAGDALWWLFGPDHELWRSTDGGESWDRFRR